MRLARCLFAVALTTLLSACVIVPLSPQESADTRQNIGDTVPAFIVPGVTTRADVLLALGEPDGASENGVQFVYTRGKRTGGYLVAGCGAMTCAGDSFEKMVYDHLIILFDDANVVTSARHESASCQKSGSQNQPCVNLAGHQLPQTMLHEASGTEVFQHATWYRGVKLGWLQDYPREGIAGTLVVGDLSILFYSADADQKSAPILDLRYTDIASVDIPRNTPFPGARGFIIGRASGTNDTFAFGVDPRGQFDAQLNERIGRLVQSRWQAARAK